MFWDQDNAKIQYIHAELLSVFCIVHKCNLYIMLNTSIQKVDVVIV